MIFSYLIGLILDFSGSMDEDAFGGKPKFEVALEVASSLLNRLKASFVSSQFYFSLVGFAAGDEGAFLPPFSEDVPYMSVLELDVDLLSVFKQRFGTSDRLRSEYNRSIATDYTKGLMKAIKTTKIYIEENMPIYDEIFVTRIMVTDGCHGIKHMVDDITIVHDYYIPAWDEVYKLARELTSLGDINYLASIIVGKNGCKKEICGMCSDLGILKRKLETYKIFHHTGEIESYELNKNCEEKFSFILHSNVKDIADVVYHLLLPPS